MKRITALLLALAVLLALPSQTFAYNLATYGPYPRDLNGFHYTVEVCVHANTGSAAWDTSIYPFHARLANAMATWNGLSGELNFVASNTCLSSDTYVLAKYGDLAVPNKGQFATGTLVACVEPWGITCWRNATLTVNYVDYTIYVGTGTPPAGQYDLQSILTHELGHGFLLHDDDNPSQQTMATSLPAASTWMRSLTTGTGSDVAGHNDAFNV